MHSAGSTCTSASSTENNKIRISILHEANSSPFSGNWAEEEEKNDSR